MSFGMGNVVEILVRSKDETKDGFAGAEKSSSAFGSKVAKGAKVAGAALVGMGAGAVYVTGKAEEARVAQERLANALDNQGVGDATGRVAAYADELEKQVAVDGEVIKASQAKLAMFDSLAATADEAGGAFDRTTAAALDMAATGFGSAESNAVLLGKALDNPTKGMARLRTAGVDFTKAEEDRIKKLQESGRLGEAQALILDKIEGKYKGSAEATKTSGAAMSIALENVSESLGAALLPYMDRFAAIVQQAAGFMTEHSGAAMAGAGVLAGLAVTVIAVHVAMKVASAVMKVATAVTKAYTLAVKALSLAMKMNPVGLIVTAVMLLVGALILAYKRSETFRKIVDGAFRTVQRGAAFAFGWIKDNWKLLLAILTGPIGLAVLVIAKHKDKIIRFFKAVPGAIKSAFTGLAEIITAPYRIAFSAIKSLWNATVGGFGFTIPDWVPKVGGKSFTIPEMARGGISGGGWTLVGERGRELVRLPSGSMVHPNGATEAMLATGSSGRVVLELRSSGTRVDDLLLEVLRGAIRVRGGDVQIVLGT